MLGSALLSEKWETPGNIYQPGACWCRGVQAASIREGLTRPWGEGCKGPVQQRCASKEHSREQGLALCGYRLPERKNVRYSQYILSA